MDRDDIDDLLNHVNLQTPDTDDSDLSSEVFSQSTEATAGDNDEPNSQFINGKEYIESTELVRPIRWTGSRDNEADDQYLIRRK